MNNIKFAISSHIGSYKKTFEFICDDLIKSGINPSNIFFFIGGFKEYRKIENNFFTNLYEVDHNSLGLGGIISVIDLNIESEYWFLLHDTISIGRNFAPAVSSKSYNTDTVSLTSDGLSMNMGAYSWSHLQRNKEQIMLFKNTNYTLSGLQEAKKKAVFYEDRFLHPKISFYNKTNRIVSEPIDFYENGTLRITEYFPDIDLKKIKANWCEKESYELKL